MSNYNILILGASYGSLLASKILFGGHSVKLVCLPAEANLINSEGFRVRIPVRGRDEQIELDSRKLPGRVSAAGATEVDPGAYDLIAPGDAGAAIRVAWGARTHGCSGDLSRSVHVHHEHAAASLYETHSGIGFGALEAGLYGARRLGRFRSRSANALQPRSAGGQATGRKG